MLVLAFTVTAGAADYAGAFPPMPLRPSYEITAGGDWSGSYIGVHIGQGWGQAGNDWASPPSYGWTPDGAMDYRSLAGGVQAGYQRQVGQVVVGVEADVSFVRLLADDAAFEGRLNEMEIDALGTLRGRLGWAADTVMIYATAGLAAARFSKGDAGNERGTPQLATGWALGGGAELAVTDALSLRAEYLHLRLGDVTSPLFVGGAGYLHRANAPTVNLLRVGANYRF
ncbi:MAG: hypothetical protein ABS76_37300 [Pelagibacterium sp. SCN 64-44]|nr:MAG: hypothetical protein ABS76_37300 [Pelagibacterium sp. SCN 64-44]